MIAADFSGGSIPAPPGTKGSPIWRPMPPGNYWISPLVDGPLRESLVGGAGGHLVVDAATVWVDDGSDPQAVVVSQPNRLGVFEDLEQPILEGRKLLVGVDPLLRPVIDLPPGAQALSEWRPNDLAQLRRAARRSLLAADALRRRLRQIPGVTIATSRRIGRSFPLIVPVEPAELIEMMKESGSLAGTPAPELPGGMVVTLGWWHTRQQIDAYAAAVRSVLLGQLPAPIPPDVHELVDDLPLRRLADSMPGEEAR